MRLTRIAGVFTGLLLGVGTLHAQSTMILGAKIGGTYSAMATSISGAEPGYRSTVHGGVTVGMTLGSTFAIEGQGVYAAKGFAADSTTGVDVDLTLNYVELPLALVWTPVGREAMISPRVYVGPVFGFRVGCSFVVDGQSSPIVDCDPQTVKDFDVGVLGGVGLKIGRGVGGLLIDIGYNYGFVDAAKTPSAGFKNRAWMASIGFVFAII